MTISCCYPVTQSYLTLCDSMDCSTTGLSVPHHLLKFAQVLDHCMGNAISSSDILFSYGPQSFPASGTFPMSQLSPSGDQNTGTSASGSVLPMSIQGWFPLRLIGWISLLSKGLISLMVWSPCWVSGVFSSTSGIKGTDSLMLCLLYSPALTEICDSWEDHNRAMSLPFNTLSRFVIAFLPRSNHFLISWLQSLSTVILEPKKTKSVTTSIFPLFAMK